MVNARVVGRIGIVAVGLGFATAMASAGTARQTRVPLTRLTGWEDSILCQLPPHLHLSISTSR
ncbi:MAG: hypothetical protein QOD34_2700 [Mycobacterium sp.]|jgi:hypothetical protein|nr:hypothetical protein [Mycobacterium sp.]